jgi:DtxR family Mn-dependent transcriptional regulator
VVVQAAVRDELTPVVLEYLELIYTLQAEGQAAFAVTLAEYLGVSRANASATVQRMVRAGFVRVAGRHLHLTEEGRAGAEAGLRRHRVTERFLTDVLHLSWVAAHTQARSFERGVSSLLLERMDAHLGYPDTCPHGNPIPRRSLAASTYLHDQQAFRLLEATPGVGLQVLLISKLVELSAALLDTCAAAGLIPGARVAVEPSNEPGILNIRTEAGVQLLEDSLATHIWVTRAAGNDAAHVQ